MTESAIEYQQDKGYCPECGSDDFWWDYGVQQYHCEACDAYFEDPEVDDEPDG